MYSLERLPRVREQLKQLPASIHAEVIQILADLSQTPFPPYAEPLRNPYEKLWKIKIDGFRLFYRVSEADKTVTVLSIKRRDRNTYTRLFSVLF